MRWLRPPECGIVRTCEPSRQALNRNGVTRRPLVRPASAGRRADPWDKGREARDESSGFSRGRSQVSKRGPSCPWRPPRGTRARRSGSEETVLSTEVREPVPTQSTSLKAPQGWSARRSEIPCPDQLASANPRLSSRSARTLQPVLWAFAPSGQVRRSFLSGFQWVPRTCSGHR